MAPTAEQYKTIIIRQLKDTKDGYLANNIDLFWLLHEEKASAGGLRLVYLLVKIECIEGLIGYFRDQVTFGSSGDLNVSLSDRIKTLEGQLERAKAEKKQYQGGAVAGMLETKAPVTAQDAATAELTTTTPDANDIVYGGSPYQRMRRVRRIP